jgi:hypothetical protein
MALELECYPVTDRPPDIIPGKPQRAWMDAFAERHPYRCLPLNMANSTGWELLCPLGFTAEWNGGPHQSDIKITPDRPNPDFHHVVTSHFSRGIMTFHAGYLFRTPPGWSLMAAGPPNLPKDGIYPLQGLVETDWLPFPFTMNWIFTRPGRVRFEKKEPFCFIYPVKEKQIDEFEPVQRSLNSNAPFKQQYDAWHRLRDDFNARLRRGDPSAMKEAWQRYYFKGELPEETGAAPPVDHVNKRRLKPVRLGF